MIKYTLSFLSFFCLAFTILSQQEARLMRFPAAYDNQVVFSYAGDLYTVVRSGGEAKKLTNHSGLEIFPKFSHDGAQIAFTGQYDGNTEVYIMPAKGGEPKRITFTAALSRDDLSDRMGPNNIVMDWTVNDQSVVYRTRRYSFNSFKGILMKADTDGSLSEQLPFSVAGFCSYNKDGSKLAYNRVFREFRTWKRYKGGMADDIWIYDFATEKTENITNHPSQDIIPMFYENKVYFLSDRDSIMNLFVYDLNSKQTEKITNFNEYDIKYPSLSKDVIAFENGGFIYLYDLKTKKQEKLNITISNDKITSRNKYVDASKTISSFDLAPDGSRVTFSARGDVFTLPAKEGIIRNLTRSSGAHDRSVSWSPDGKWIAFVSDRNGEDEVYVQKQDGSEKAKQLTSKGDGYKYYPVWSPNSKYLLLSDRALNLYYVDVNSGETVQVAKSNAWEFWDYNWSPDGKWIAYTKPQPRGYSKIVLYNLTSKKHTEVTEGWYSAFDPVFSKDGKYLYFISDRHFSPSYNRLEWNHAYFDLAGIYMIPLQKETESPFQLKSDEVNMESEEKEEEKNKKDKDNPKEEKDLKIDLEGISNRVESLPVSSGSYWGITPVDGGVYYLFISKKDSKPSLKFFDFESKEECAIGPFSQYIISSNQKKMLVKDNGKYYIEDLPKAKLTPENQVNLEGMKVWVDLSKEWEQIYNESWRQMRDFFYDPNMHGVNWSHVKEKYAQLLPYVHSRYDLSYIIGEMIGELNVGHAYVGGGDKSEIEKIPVGLLGATFSKDNSGYYKVDRILDGEAWSEELMSPLEESVGEKVQKGDYIIAINGQETKNMINIYEGLLGLSDQVIELKVNDKPSSEGAKKVLVKPIKDESSLYYHNWIQDNIKKVSEASNGQIGYIHIPDMLSNGLNQFAKYFYPQFNKKALIIDDRGNGGGNVSSMIIERLRRQVDVLQMMRNSTITETSPEEIHVGPKVCLINQYSASDGDLFPYRFRNNNLGKLLGQRSWGGVVGIRGSLPFVDGGTLHKPEFAHFAADGSKWIIEGEGVSPDIELINDPHDEFKGKDAQLEKAVELLIQELKEKDVDLPPIPPFPKK